MNKKYVGWWKYLGNVDLNDLPLTGQGSLSSAKPLAVSSNPAVGLEEVGQPHPLPGGPTPVHLLITEVSRTETSCRIHPYSVYT